ncbi:hypothetical protein [Nocardioides sp. TF02-7]|uniref:hypothetical protein n=1 Tax=Nocardioides sp. TF02-7 TaxID=2917724 RepID=UPI001F055611|nr:hypothetical protein [Nocardioides sp. TF02-7]UMG93323.1 hypothetical protein MF408_03320 [Nocardioides sp. TF02-7]
MSTSTTKRRLIAAGITALAATAATLAPSATVAQAPPKASTVAKDLLSPLSVEVDAKGAVYYSENFAGKLLVKRPGKKAKVLYADDKGREVGAISVASDGTVYFVRAAALMKRTPVA